LLVGTWIAMALLFRYSSAAALAAAAATPFYAAWILSAPSYVAMSVAMSLILIARHAKNIRNLLAGKEARIGR